MIENKKFFSNAIALPFNGRNQLKSRLVVGLAATLCLLSITGCETKEDNKIAKAQTCLDGATQASAANCSAMVSGLTSMGAYKIRCSAGYISEGFTSERFAQAFDKIANNKTQTGSTLTAITNMVFSSTAVANAIFEDCSKAGSPGMLNLATLSKTATTLMSATGNLASILAALDNDGEISDSELATIKGNLDPNTMSPADKEVVGGQVLELNTQYCAMGSAYADTKICTDLGTAIGSSSGDKAALAELFLNQIKNN